MQYYLADENVVNKYFLKDVLSGKKAMIKKADVELSTVPHYDELSVKSLWPQLSKTLNSFNTSQTCIPLVKDLLASTSLTS